MRFLTAQSHDLKCVERQIIVFSNCEFKGNFSFPKSILLSGSWFLFIYLFIYFFIYLFIYLFIYFCYLNFQ